MTRSGSIEEYRLLVGGQRRGQPVNIPRDSERFFDHLQLSHTCKATASAIPRAMTPSARCCSDILPHNKPQNPQFSFFLLFSWPDPITGKERYPTIVQVPCIPDVPCNAKFSLKNENSMNVKLILHFYFTAHTTQAWRIETY